MNNPYHPRRTFDDQEVALGNLCVEKSWSFARAELDALKAKAAEAEAAFMKAQHERYDHFALVPHSARVAFRKDAATTAALAQFRRVRRSKGNTPLKAA